MARPLRLLLYTHVDAAEAGGVQTVVGHLTRGLASRGHKVHSIWGDATGATGGRRVCRLYYRGVEELRRPGGRHVHLPSLLRAAALLAETRPDVVHIHFVTRAACYFLHLRRLFGYRLVLTAHGSDVRRPCPEDAPLLPAIFAGADGLTAVSADLGERIRNLTGGSERPVRLIANGVDTGFWSPTSQPVGHPPTLVAVGRLESVKGPDLLLDAFAQVAADVPDVRLCLIGDGSEAGALRAQAQRLGIAGRVDFTGSLAPEAIRDRLRDAAAYVLPSRSEGMPVALLEAMACGRPCVASSVGGVPEVGTGAALLVPPEDPAALASALRALLETPALATRLAAAGRSRALAYSSETALDAYEESYRAALAPST